MKLWKMSEPVGELDEDEEEETMLTRYGRGNRAAAKEEGKLYGHRFVVEDMILAVRDGRDPLVTPTEAMKSVAIIEAIYESAKSGKTVYLDGSC